MTPNLFGVALGAGADPVFLDRMIEAGWKPCPAVPGSTWAEVYDALADAYEAPGARCLAIGWVLEGAAREARREDGIERELPPVMAHGDFRPGRFRHA